MSWSYKAKRSTINESNELTAGVKNARYSCFEYSLSFNATDMNFLLKAENTLRATRVIGMIATHACRKSEIFSVLPKYTTGIVIRSAPTRSKFVFKSIFKFIVSVFQIEPIIFFTNLASFSKFSGLSSLGFLIEML